MEGASVQLRSSVLSCPVTSNKVSVSIKEKKDGRRRSWESTDEIGTMLEYLVEAINMRMCPQDA